MYRILALILLIGSIQSCSLNNIEEDDSLEKYFKKHNLTGTFGMFDNAQGRFLMYNLDHFRDSLRLPASTFKIVNSLIGLHTGVVPDTNMVIPWDGVQRFVPAWNRDLTMKEAFQASAVPWFQELARRIGKDTMQYWLDSMGYAEQFKKPVITHQNLDTFWLDNSVKVSGDEQLGLVKRLYFDQLPFQKRAHRLVKDMMIMEDNSNYRLSYKSGWATSDRGAAIGWLIGWIEENQHLYFFVLQVESPDRNYDMSKVRLEILKDILRQHGFMEGRK